MNCSRQLQQQSPSSDSRRGQPASKGAAAHLWCAAPSQGSSGRSGTRQTGCAPCRQTPPAPAAPRWPASRAAAPQAAPRSSRLRTRTRMMRTMAGADGRQAAEPQQKRENSMVGPGAGHKPSPPFLNSSIARPHHRCCAFPPVYSCQGTQGQSSQLPAHQVHSCLLTPLHPLPGAEVAAAHRHRPAGSRR